MDEAAASGGSRDEAHRARHGRALRDHAPYIFNSGQISLDIFDGCAAGIHCRGRQFFALGLSVQKAAAKPDKAKQIMQLSYSMRMLVMALCVILAMATPAFHWVAAVLPLIFPRVTIGIMQIMGKYKPARKEAE